MAPSVPDQRAHQDHVFRVILLPGIIMPAELRYPPLVGALGDRAQAISKELEIYAGDTPGDDYSIAREVEGITRAADEAGFARFHLYGHSGGGAAALAYAATHPDRLLSLAIDEPASDFSDEVKSDYRQELARIRQLPEAEQMRAFAVMQLAPGVEPPPPPGGPAPDWMKKRPAGIDAIIEAMDACTLPIERLRAFQQPVYFSYGSLTHPRWEAMSQRLASVFPDFTVERFEGLHHFNTSHAAEPERVAETLIGLWGRAEGRAGSVAAG